MTEQIIANNMYAVAISSQKEQRKVGTNTMLTGCRLGHKKNVERGNIEQALQRGQRANEKARKLKEQEQRERVLVEQIAANKL